MNNEQLRDVVVMDMSGETYKGKFHKWTPDAETGDDYALVEDEDGIMTYVSMQRIRFLHSNSGCQKNDVIHIPESGIGNVSDGYHTFNELYHHRAILFSALCNMFPEVAWKSKKHHDGSMFEGMFIVGIETPEGQATYHYDIDPYWDIFNVKELEFAPEWDGHTPEQAIDRIKTFSKLISSSMSKGAKEQGNEVARGMLEGLEDECDRLFEKAKNNASDRKNSYFKRLFCRHQYEYVHIDYIYGGVRKAITERCKKCGKIRISIY